MISICIATYNGEKYIKEQLLSILQQLSPFDEVIISDDNSSDGTLAIIQDLNDPRIRVYKNKGDKGYTPNFENAIGKANGEFIFLSDQDDIWEPNKIKVCMEYLNKYDYVVSDATIVDKNGILQAPSFYRKRGARAGLLHNLIRFSYLGCCIAFKKKLLEKVLPFPPNHRYCTHDNWITIIAMAYYKVAIIPEPLIKYRRYDTNTSSGGFSNTTSLWFKVKYRIYIILWLIRRKKSYWIR